jgi:predicted signal transduction protein with EAL and GGDEF domain
MGHHIGDLILQKVARRLETNLRQSDTLSRYAGDEFVLLLPMLEDIAIVETVAAKVLDAIRAPFMIEQSPIEITASVGIAICPDDASSTLDAIAKADQACDHAKSSGKNASQFFTEEMQQRSDHKMYLKKALTKALQERALDVYYQPIVNLQTQQIEKCEALVRWHHEGQFISPMEFIPIAEEFQLASDLGRLVLEKTCQQLRELDQTHPRPIKIAVNRSVAEFPKANNPHDDWLEIIREQNVDAKRIAFEITESILAPENSEFTDYLSTLKQAGCTISLDDFGTGYSSLSYLRTFPIDKLKIDRSFIADLEDNEEALTLVSTIIAMAKALGMKTIAEGVETVGQLHKLEELGCDYIQGYFFSRPLPGGELKTYLQHFNYTSYL